MMSTFVLIGEGALALYCLDSLVTRGHSPIFVASFDASLAEACTQRGIPHTDRNDIIRQWMSEEGADYLLSIRNPWRLPAELLGQVRRIAINFHDSLLPRYAGLHATSWALMHGERDHGISWHEITPGLDEGRLLLQVNVSITHDDTAFTLNTKCFRAATDSFATVLDSLHNDPVVLTPQRGIRTYFSRQDRPSAQGVIDFEQPARSIVDGVRALDFGHALNPLGRAKLWSGDEFILVRSAAVGPSASEERGGVLCALDRGELRITTRTEDVILSGLTGVDGGIIEAPALVEKLTPWLNRPLPRLGPAQRAEISERDRQVSRNESAWIRRLNEEIVAVDHPMVPPGRWAPMRRWEPTELNAWSGLWPAQERGARIRARLVAYLARSHTKESFDLGVIRPERSPVWQGIFQSIVPLRLPDASQPFEAFEGELSLRWDELERLGTMACDLQVRTPALRGRATLPSRWPIALMMGDRLDPALDRAVGLVIGVDPKDGHVRLWATESISDGALASIEAQLLCVAQAIADDAQHPVDDLPLVSDRDRTRMLVEWNATQRAIPNLCMHEWIADQARRTPEAIAVSFGTKRLKFSQLDARANQVAHALLGRGVKPEDRVALAIPRGVELIVGLLGILKAGAAYVPMDRAVPDERLALFARESEPAMVLTGQEALGGPLEEIERLCLHRDAMLIASQPQTAPPISLRPDRLAYVLFTSGSTGEPKGVEVAHRSLVNHSVGVQEHYGFAPGDRVLCSASIGFDVAAEQILVPLVHGAEVVVRPDDLLESFRDFDRFVREQALTALTLPTALWHQWVRWLELHDLRGPPSLRVLSVGTESVSRDVWSAWRARGTQHVRFIQGYGPTEATITCTMFRLDGDEALGPGPVPIGRPLANIEIYLLDSHDRPVPVGMPGELCVGGLGLARGYRGRPGLTAERFTPHPWGERGTRIYRTGDRARYEPNGQLIFLGRSDFQVKIRGFRVELGEIESVLCRHPLVDEAVVILHEPLGAAPQLVAYLRTHDEVESASLQSTCEAVLPSYMVPSQYQVLDAFPVTRNGKIDRGALPRPTAAQPLAITSPSPSPSPERLEQRISREFADILQLPSVEVHDGFFARGGDSLRAMLLLDRLETAFGIHLPLTRFFAEDTVAALAAAIRQSDPYAHAVDEPAVVKLKDGTGDPLYFILGVAMYTALTQALRTDRPVYAIVQPVESDLLRKNRPLPAVEVLARQNLELLRAHQPEGPYCLGGYSFGGLVAYHMAQVLRAEGAQVPLLALFDCVLPRGRQIGFGDGLRAVIRWVRHGQLHPMVTAAGHRIIHALRRRSHHRNRPALDRAQADVVRWRSVREQEYGRNTEAYDRVIQPYAGTVVLYRALELRTPVKALHGFASLVRGRLLAYDVPGGHDSILHASHVARLARHLDGLLTSLRSERSSGTGCDLEPRRDEAVPYQRYVVPRLINPVIGPG